MHINRDVTTRFDPNSIEPSTHCIPVPSYGNYGTAASKGERLPNLPI
jgi:hypothetical protein